MHLFPAKNKEKPHTENIRGLNLAAVKLTTVEVTKLKNKVESALQSLGWQEAFT